MRTVRQLLTIGGTLLMALPVLLSCSAAQDTSPTLRTLYNFTGGRDGSYPLAGLIVGPNGVLYGTTDGGTTGNGTVFSLTPPASPGGAWTATVLHNFAGAPTDGFNPMANVTISASGVLYGTTSAGGTSGGGTVFSLTPPESPGAAWTETVLHNFAGGDDGALPLSAVVIGRGGVLYGTAQNGGPASSVCFNGCGMVFALKPPAAAGGAWTKIVLHAFVNSDGANPVGGLAIGNGGVLYGTTSSGGTAANGTVFSLTPSSLGGSWTEAVLYNFTGGSDGGFPAAAVTLTEDRQLFGTTFVGGAFDFGTAFSLTAPAAPGGSWTETVLHTFGSASHDGLAPTNSGLVIGSGGVLYGTCQNGGSTSSGCGFMGCGTVFNLIPPASAGGAWTESILHYFDSTDGTEPFGGVVIGRGGLLYGTTAYGGTANSGTVQLTSLTRALKLIRRVCPL